MSMGFTYACLINQFCLPNSSGSPCVRTHGNGSIALTDLFVVEKKVRSRLCSCTTSGPKHLICWYEMVKSSVSYSRVPSTIQNDDWVSECLIRDVSWWIHWTYENYIFIVVSNWHLGILSYRITQFILHDKCVLFPIFKTTTLFKPHIAQSVTYFWKNISTPQMCSLIHSLLPPHHWQF